LSRLRVNQELDPLGDLLRLSLHLPLIAQDPKMERFDPPVLLAEMYMSYWYAELYVVVEGLQQLKLSDPVIDSLLASPNLDLLRRYRNGVFHYQKNYFDDRLLNFMRDGQNGATWAQQLTEVIGEYLLRELHRLPGKVELT
jgi:hypothetical protein